MPFCKYPSPIVYVTLRINKSGVGPRALLVEVGRSLLAGDCRHRGSILYIVRYENINEIIEVFQI